MPEMTEDERARFTDLVIKRRETQYGTVSAAQRAAGISMEAWRGLERGERKKPHIIRKVVIALWPDAEGDWRNVEGMSNVNVTKPTPADSDGPEQLEDLARRVAALERFVFRTSTPDEIEELVKESIADDVVEAEKSTNEPRESPRADAG